LFENKNVMRYFK